MSGVTQIDTKFHEVIMEPSNVSCRACSSFQRVRHNVRSAHHMRGFCKIGGGEGEFNLYYSSSDSHHCQALIIYDYNLETKKLEDELQQDIRELREKIHNKRTKEYKLFKEFVEKSKALVCKDKKPLSAFSIEMEFLEEGALAYEWFYSVNVDRFSALYKRKAMNRSQYNLLMTNIIQSIAKNVVVE
jgi:hypothetical protein